MENKNAWLRVFNILIFTSICNLAKWSYLSNFLLSCVDFLTLEEKGEKGKFIIPVQTRAWIQSKDIDLILKGVSRQKIGMIGCTWGYDGVTMG